MISSAKNAANAMGKASFTRKNSAAALAQSVSAEPDLRADRSRQITRPDTDYLAGKMQAKRGAAGRNGPLGARLAAKAKTARRFGVGAGGGGFGGGDLRQQAVVKVHYYAHAGGGGGALKAHAAYVAREGAGREEDLSPALDEAQNEARRHADYLSRDGAEGRDVFYSADRDRVDGAEIAAQWAGGDKRHFRIVLAAERGGDLKDLPAYTREVMARAEAALGRPLAWIAIDHWDTDNPHTHIILRGRDRLGRDLALPRDFIRHGLRGLARDVATEALGPRTPDQAREALFREARRHGPTRLDGLIAEQLPANGVVRIAALKAPTQDPALTQALKARAQELERLGLAKSARRGTLAFAPDWRDRLKAIELHLDIAKRMAQARQAKVMERAMGLVKGIGVER